MVWVGCVQGIPDVLSLRPLLPTFLSASLQSCLGLTPALHSQITPGRALGPHGVPGIELVPRKFLLEAWVYLFCFVFFIVVVACFCSHSAMLRARALLGRHRDYIGIDLIQCKASTLSPDYSTPMLGCWPFGRGEPSFSLGVPPACSSSPHLVALARLELPVSACGCLLSLNSKNKPSQT